MRRKKVSLIFKSANYLGMALTLYAFAGIIALEIGYYSNFVNLFVVFPVYFLGQILQAFAYAGKKAKKRTVWMITKLSFFLSILALWDIISIFLFLPFIALMILTGPFMGLACFCSAVMLLLYAYESIFGDIKGYSSFSNYKEALVGLAVFLGSGGIIWYQVSAEDNLLDKGVDILEKIREYLQTAADNCMRDETSSSHT